MARRCTLTNWISEVSSLFNYSCISSGVKFTLTPLSRYDCNLFSFLVYVQKVVSAVLRASLTTS